MIFYVYSSQLLPYGVLYPKTSFSLFTVSLCVRQILRSALEQTPYSPSERKKNKLKLKRIAMSKSDVQTNGINSSLALYNKERCYRIMQITCDF